MNSKFSRKGRALQGLILIASLTLGILLIGGQTPAYSFMIYGDPSDFEAYSNGGFGDNWLGDMGVGDTGGDPGPYVNLGRRALIKFSLDGLQEELQVDTLAEARLYLTILETRRDQYPAPGTIDDIPPFTNPGLGPVHVFHIADYGEPSADDYDSPPSSANPGQLINPTHEPGSVVSIDVTHAVSKALEENADYVAFRIQINRQTDFDSLNDLWFFASADHSDVTKRPYIDCILE